MSSLRQDPLTGRWVIMAAERAGRPNEYGIRGREVTATETCPFCPDHEDRTTPEIVAVGRPEKEPTNGPGWRIRVVPNLYPALRQDSKALDATTAPWLKQRPAEGRHEVVIYAPEHDASLAILGPGRLAEVLNVLRDRVVVMEGLPDTQYVSVFCNHGPEAGATLAHPHLQIIGTPECPHLARLKNERLAAFEKSDGGCLVCRMIEAEEAAATRCVRENRSWVVVTPWASRFPFEMLAVPRRHAPSLGTCGDEELRDMAEVLDPLLKRLAKLHGDLSLNVVIHNGTRGPDRDRFHWHLEILPRLSRTAGFEAGTGFAINSIYPEEAARLLRGEVEAK